MTLRSHRTLLEAVRFAAVGVLATALHYGLYLALLRAVPANVAYATGYVVSFLANFYLTAFFTFRARPSWRRFTGMAGAHGVNFLLHMTLLNAFLWLGVPEAIAPVPVFAVAIPVNFLLVRWVFTHKSNRHS